MEAMAVHLGLGTREVYMHCGYPKITASWLSADDDGVTLLDHLLASTACNGRPARTRSYTLPLSTAHGAPRLCVCIQGLCRMIKEYYREPIKAARLWVHECERVFRDRMINDADMVKFDEFRVACTKK